MLLHERFNDADAAGLFREALARDPSNAEAYVGLAMVSADGFDGKAAEYLAKAIQLDPKLAKARELMADLLSRTTIVLRPRRRPTRPSR